MLVVAFAGKALKSQHRLQDIIEIRCIKQSNYSFIVWARLNLMKRVEIPRSGCVCAKTELNSIFEFQWKFPLSEPDSSQRQTWL